MKTTDLTIYVRPNYNPGRNIIVQCLWYFVNHVVFGCPFFICYGLKRWLLRLFGAKVGERVIIKPNVNIKFPWRLEIGDNVWIGEKAWIDNIDVVKIGRNAVLSQHVLVITGSHNYKKTNFELITHPVVIEDGVWVCANATVLAGSYLKSHSMVTAGSVAPKTAEPYSIYTGNPAVKVKNRIIG
jgi:putative colanic acid biosynthesis acetyltransferase WcaF